MSSENVESVTFFFHQLRQGDEVAVERLWEKCAPRILSVAQRTLAKQIPQYSDQEDIAQSVFLSLWSRATRGEMDGEFHRENLWRLLTTMTVRRALKHQRRDRTQKRGGGRVLPESSVPGGADSPFRLDQALEHLSSHEFDVMCAEQLLQLDEDLRAVAIMKLMNHTQQEIADALNCSISSVERKIRLLRKLWKDDQSD
ncbi:MAG: sigma-70 family RNA polymerase sigma factor [Planctomycetaceae bacterium]|nr:sigma-70 family RNA polymerase sigma factor [Planctomycetaceae bacterium]